MSARKHTQYRVLISGDSGKSLTSCGEVEAFNPEQARGRARKLEPVLEQIRKLGGRGEMFVVPQTSLIPSPVETSTNLQKGDSSDA